MNRGFDQAYAMYLSSLEQLDKTDHIYEKNILFRQITHQLSELEARLNTLAIRSSVPLKHS